jgi:hypothetical protein
VRWPQVFYDVKFVTNGRPVLNGWFFGVTLGHKHPSIIEPRFFREMNTSGGQEPPVHMSAIARVIKIAICSSGIFD